MLTTFILHLAALQSMFLSILNLAFANLLNPDMPATTAKEFIDLLLLLLLLLLFILFITKELFEYKNMHFIFQTVKK
jgi:hypothetical protein